LRPKYSWGQNFLTDPWIHRGIVRELLADAPRQDAPTVVEIGAGLGTLTGHLLAEHSPVVAIERDRELVAVLRHELGAHPRLAIAEANAMTFDYGGVAPGARLRVVGNLPYQIASQLLFRVLAPGVRGRVDKLVVLLQREMAERIAAPPDTPSYGRLSVMCQLLASVRLCFRVKAGAFFPAPKVESAVLSLTPRRDAVPPDLERALSVVVAAAFRQRRKTLRSALRGLLDEEAIRGRQVEPGARGESLDGPAFVRLASAFRSTPAFADHAGPDELAPDDSATPGNG
jgi:16S rRNA (adenine1518-N6/adenine1519-N6)-dimethyltransferase